MNDFNIQIAIQWAERNIGSTQALSEKSWPTTHFTKVFKLSTRAQNYYLKIHSLTGKYQQEKRAYQDWAIHLKNTPELLAYDDENMFLLMTAVPGNLVEAGRFGQNELEDIYFQAGSCLKKLHALSFVDNDKLSIRQAYAKRLKAWLPRARPMLAQKDIDWVEARVLEILPMLEDHKRVPCHRDFSARNWLYNRDKLFLIDFEHSRPDFFLSDLERLWGLVFITKPVLKEAFFAAYKGLSDDEIEMLKRSTALWAMNTISWAYEHNDKVFEQVGRRVLQQLQKQG